MTLIEALNLAVRHLNAGNLDEADRILAAIHAVMPDQAETLHFMGLVHSARGDAVAADRHIRRAIAAQPALTVAYGNLGVVAQNLKRHQDAVTAQTRALTLQPGFADAAANRGSARLDAGDLQGAIADLEEAARLRPGFAMAHNNLGMALRQASRHTEAVAAHRRALDTDPNFVDAHLQLGHALRESGRLSEAQGAYAEALRRDPSRTEALGYLLYLKQTMCDWDGFDDLCRQVYDTIDNDTGIVLPLATLSIGTTLAQQYRSAGRFYRSIVRGDRTVDPPPPPRAAATDGRLRIGYFSADFHEHATAYLTAELFELHDPERFRITAYSFGPDDGSPMRRRLVAAFDTFRDIRGVGLDEVQRLAAADGIDILVDVKTFTKGSRMDLLSRRLAPVQATWLAYPGTIGGGPMDYIIADPVVAPFDHQPYYSERIVHLPDSYQSNDRRRPIAEPAPTRAECGLPDNAFVFCCFNTAYKILPETFAAWMRLLHRVPDSVLWLYQANTAAERNLRAHAAAAGVDPARLVFAPNRPLAQHLARYQLADLFVDTFPYTAHTTASDALWAGLPVVTLEGGTFASRVGASLLRAANLPELITTSRDDFEALALALAGDRARLAALRRQLLETRMTVPLFDSRRFTRHMERAFEMMWEIHRSGQPPRAFAVPSLDS